MEFGDELKNVLSLSDYLTQAFLRAGVVSVRDLLFHLPLRYEDRSHITPIAGLRDGQSVLVHGKVLHTNVKYARRRMLYVDIQDNGGDVIRLTYFRFFPSQLKQFQVDRWGLFYGKVNFSSHGFGIAHPEVTWLQEGEVPALSSVLQAVYPTVKGLTQARWQQNINRLLSQLELPENDSLTQAGYWSLSQSLQTIHQPKANELLPTPENNRHPARKRLIVEEFCANQLSLLDARVELRRLPAPSLPTESELLNQFIFQLPFSLTPAQQRVQVEISNDLFKCEPMLRLVQGDVGSGKTIVALMACLQAIAEGKQAVFLAPTELLAEQHANNMEQLLTGFPVKIMLLVGKQRAKIKRQNLDDIASGKAQLIIGTHAVFQAQVQYHDLALIAIDEQHRFGVHQRLELQNKGKLGQGVHQLILTATPIPRTLAMSAYGELDTSIIDCLPAGRQPIRTSVLSNTKRDEVIRRVGNVCAQGAQVYWVCPLIEESEALECENAEATAERIQLLLPKTRVAIIHGRMDGKKRHATMNDFIQRNIDLLVATTVIEVGVDVPNASLMIIENAERFGLSQLHQLRGRVGRGSVQSDCLLMYQAPLGEIAKRRLNIMRETTDGFRIAEEDLAIRGAGELLGTQQTGEISFRVANLTSDGVLLEEAEQLVSMWKNDDTSFKEDLLNRWIGEKKQYLNV